MGLKRDDTEVILPSIFPSPDDLPRSRNFRFFLSGAEVIAAAEQQLEIAGGIEDTPFVTITVTIDAADSTKRIVSAYQVRKMKNKHLPTYYRALSHILSVCQITKQGMEMAAEGALLVSSNLGSCGIDPTFTAQVEHRNVKEVSAVEVSLHSNIARVLRE